MSEDKTLAKVVGGLEDLTTFIAKDDFLAIINKTPPDQFVKDHPFATGVKYIPIGKIEMLLTKIFQLWNVEVLDSGQLFNSIYVTVRLHYKHPLTGEMQYQDGVGAVAVQVEKGQSPSDLAKIRSDAVMKGLPAAKSFAIKDAAEHLGKLFGRDINRKDTMAFSPSYGTDEAKEQAKKDLKKKLNESN